MVENFYYFCNKLIRFNDKRLIKKRQISQNKSKGGLYKNNYYITTNEFNLITFFIIFSFFFYIYLFILSLLKLKLVLLSNRNLSQTLLLCFSNKNLCY